MKKSKTPDKNIARTRLYFDSYTCHIDNKDNRKNLEICFRYYVNDRLLKAYAPLADCISHPNKVVKMLISSGYRPPSKDHISDALEQYVALENPPFKYWTNRPGWHGHIYVYPIETLEQEIMYRGHSSVRLGPNIIIGDIETQIEALQPFQYGSRFIHAIGLAFLGLILSPLELDPFAAIYYGESSKGKTSLQYFAASISGNIGNGLVGFATLESALEEYAKGANHDCLHIDELGSRGLNEADLSKALTKTIFNLFNPATKSRSSIYENNSKTVTFSPVLTGTFTNEKLVKFDRAGSAARASQMPAISKGAVDIFDHPRADTMTGMPGIERADFMEKTLKILRRNQGHLKPAFINAVQKDDAWKSKIRKFVNNFNDAAKHRDGKDIAVKTVEIRVQKNFAHIYAALMLAIEYNLLDWNRKRVLNAIKKCLIDTIECLPVEKTSTQNGIVLKTPKEAIDAFKAAWKGVKCLVFRDSKPISSDLVEEADVFHFPRKPKLAGQILMKPERLKALFDESVRVRLFEIFKDKGIFIVNRADSFTRQYQLKEISPTKKYYYAFDVSKLAEILGDDNSCFEINPPKKRRK